MWFVKNLMPCSIALKVAAIKVTEATLMCESPGNVARNNSMSES